MVAANPRPSLQLDEDFEFQRRQMRLQAIAWTAMALLLLAGLAGVFGGGWLSRVTAEAEGLQVDYPRFMRMQTPQTLQLRFDAGGLRGGEARVAVERRWIEHFAVEQITPDPIAVEAAEDGLLVYRFALAPGARSLQVSIELQPKGPGRVTGRIGGTELRQLVYP